MINREPDTINETGDALTKVKMTARGRRLGMNAVRVGAAAFAVTLVWASIPVVTKTAEATTAQVMPASLEQSEQETLPELLPFAEAPLADEAELRPLPSFGDADNDGAESPRIAAVPVDEIDVQVVAAAPAPVIVAPPVHLRAPVVNAAPAPIEVVATPAPLTEAVLATPTIVPMAPAGPTVAVPLSTAQVDSDQPEASGTNQSIDVNIGQSVVLDTPWPVSRVSITQTEIADVEVLAPDQVLLIGNELGTTDMILWSEDGYVWHARVNVGIDLSHIHEELDRIFPQCDLVIQQSQDVLVIGGQLRRIEQVAQLRAMLDSYEIKYVDKTSVAGLQQVMLNVSVAEVSRDAVRALGANVFYGGPEFFGGITIGPDMGGALNPLTPAANVGIPFSTDVASGITLFGGFPGSDLVFFVQALAENKYLRVLAEPTLVALSGEEANFLAGGEFPVPVVQGTSAGAGTSITIEYKEFGVRLRFIPTVLGENRIRLYVAPEVSTLSDFGAIEIEGFRVPAVRTRRSETTLEVNSGQAFMMAGLLNDSAEARNSSVPLLGDLPIVGTLFRSVRYVQGETELLVMVTATLVEPSSPANFPLPGDLHMTPSDWDLYMDGKLEAKSNDLAPIDAAWIERQGFDRLHGPGSWSTYGTPAAAGDSEVSTFESHQMSASE